MATRLGGMINGYHMENIISEEVERRFSFG